MNSVIDNLLSRTSIPKATGPAPSDEQLEVLLQAAGRACDHKRLRPYRFIKIQGDDALAKFGQLMVASQTEIKGELESDLADKLSKKPFRAPLILAVVASVRDEPKVPEIEQIITAGCAAQLMVSAAHALGLAAMWRSGNMMYTRTMARGMGLAENESMVGLIYLGTNPVGRSPAPVGFDSKDYLTEFN